MRRETRVSTKANRLGGTAAVLAAAALLLTGCGSQDDGAAATPKQVSGQASPLKGDKGGDSAPSDSATPGGEANGGGSGDDSGSDDSGSGKGSGGGDESADPTAKAPDGSTGSGTGGSGTSGSGGGGTARKTACHTSEMKGSVGANHPGAGQENFALVLTNSSSRTCTVYGFPGVAFVDASGGQVSVDPERTQSTKSVITLAPGKSAYAPLTFSNPEMTGVTTVTPAAVKLTPPDERDSLNVTWNGGPVTNTGKASVPRVGTLQPGTGE